MIHLHAIDLNLFTVFEAIYKHRNLTKAGESIGLSQSAVSHALSRLRKLCNDPLFVRLPGNMEPTRQAIHIYNLLEPSLNGIRTILNKQVEFDPGSMKKTFKLSMSDYSAMIILPPLLDALNKKSFDIKIEIYDCPADETQKELDKGRIELVIGHRDVGQRIYRKSLFTDKFVCVVRKDHPIIKERLTLARYLRSQHAIFSLRANGDAVVEKTLTQMGYQRNIAVRVPHIQTLPRIIETTDMVGTIPNKMAMLYSGKNKLRIFKPPIDFPPLEVMLYWHEKLDSDQANQWMRSLISEII